MAEGQIIKLAHPIWSGNVTVLAGQSYDIRTGQVVEDRLVSEAVSTMLEKNFHDLDDDQFDVITKKWSASARTAAAAARAGKGKGDSTFSGKADKGKYMDKQGLPLSGSVGAILALRSNYDDAGTDTRGIQGKADPNPKVGKIVDGVIKKLMGGKPGDLLTGGNGYRLAYSVSAEQAIGIELRTGKIRNTGPGSRGLVIGQMKSPTDGASLTAAMKGVGGKFGPSMWD